MKNGLPCPKCESRKVWRIRPLKSRGEHQPATVPVAFTTDSSVWVGCAEGVGTFDTYVCAECGYTEFFAEDFAQLKPDPERGIELFDHSPRQGGYR